MSATRKRDQSAPAPASPTGVVIRGFDWLHLDLDKDHLNPLWPGHPYPLGATFDGSGVNFALFSEVADKVELALIDDAGAETRVELTEVDGHVWHGFVATIQPGQRYGFRVHGPYDPANGYRCNPAKLLLDPYAKAIDGQIDGDRSLYSYDLGDPATSNADFRATGSGQGVS